LTPTDAVADLLVVAVLIIGTPIAFFPRQR